jgi:hypothetical protein
MQARGRGGGVWSPISTQRLVAWDSLSVFYFVLTRESVQFTHAV